MQAYTLRGFHFEMDYTTRKKENDCELLKNSLTHCN
jgi:hypothetical protein